MKQESKTHALSVKLKSAPVRPTFPCSAKSLLHESLGAYCRFHTYAVHQFKAQSCLFGANQADSSQAQFKRAAS